MAYELASAYSVRAIRVSQYARCNFLYVDQSSSRDSRRLEKIGEDIPTCSEVIGAHTLNFRPKFKFLQYCFFGGGIPFPLGCALKALVNL